MKEVVEKVILEFLVWFNSWVMLSFSVIRTVEGESEQFRFRNVELEINVKYSIVMVSMQLDNTSQTLRSDVDLRGYKLVGGNWRKRGVLEVENEDMILERSLRNSAFKR